MSARSSILAIRSIRFYPTLRRIWIVKLLLVIVLVALGASLPFTATAGQSNQRTPISPISVGAEQIQFNGAGIPQGYMILGETPTPPPGYSFTGLSEQFNTGEPPAWHGATAIPIPRRGLAVVAVRGTLY